MAKNIKKTSRKGSAKASKASTKTASKKGKKAAKANLPAKPSFRMDDWAREENARTTGNAFANVEKKYQEALATEGKSVILKLEVGAVINAGLAKMDSAKVKMTGKGLNAKEREWFYVALQDRGIVTGLYDATKGSNSKLARTMKCKNINHWSLTADFWLASPEMSAHIKAGVAFDCYRRIANASNDKKGETAAAAKKRENGVLKAVKAIADCNEDNAPSIDDVRKLLGEVVQLPPAAGPIMVNGPGWSSTWTRLTHANWNAARAELVGQLLSSPELDVEIIVQKDGKDYPLEMINAIASEDGKTLVIRCEQAQ